MVVRDPDRARLRGARRCGRPQPVRARPCTTRRRRPGGAHDLRGARRPARRGARDPLPAPGDRRPGLPRLARDRRPAAWPGEVRRAAHPAVKLVLAVIDGLKPSMLERAVQTGRAPVLGALMQRGAYVDDCVAAFPSVTPTCAASIATGTGPDQHHIPSMNWYSRAERRYVEYGSRFSASRRFGLTRQLTDTVYNMNGAHLNKGVRTVFEVLDDADVRTAGTTYLMYRGRHRHEIARDTALARVAGTLFKHPVLGPRELFYADIFASQRTPCRSQLGMPGVRDRH